MKRTTRSSNTVRERRAAIVAILEQSGPMTQTAVWEALQKTQHRVGRSMVGKDLRELHKSNRAHRRPRQQWGQREVFWDVPQGAQAPEGPQELEQAYRPPSNVGKVLVFQMPHTRDPAPREKASRCRHGMRCEQCWACGGGR